MKRFLNPVFTFILGALIFGSIGVVSAYNLFASNIGYTPKDSSWNVDNVNDALDDLATKIKPNYTDIYRVTPSFSEQTLSTKDKTLNDNITVEAIPSTYKNLTSNTTASASDIKTGKTAYDNNGNLITGNYEGIGNYESYVILETGTYSSLSQGSDSTKNYTITLKNTYKADQNARFIVTNITNATYPNNWYGRFNSTKEKIVGNKFTLGVCNYSGSWQTASIDYAIIGYNK